MVGNGTETEALGGSINDPNEGKINFEKEVAQEASNISNEGSP